MKCPWSHSKHIRPLWLLLKMASALLRRLTGLKAMAKFQSVSWPCVPFSSLRAPTFRLASEKGDSGSNYGDRYYLSPLFSDNSNEVCMKDCAIELVDDEAWQVSLGIADAWRVNDERKVLETKSTLVDHDQEYNGVVKFVNSIKGSPDFDEIDDLRIRGSLFYKIDKDSKEYDEYKFDFHGRKNSKNQNNQKENKKKKEQDHGSCKLESKIEKTSKKNELKELKKNKVERIQGVDKNELKRIKKNEVERLNRVDKNEQKEINRNEREIFKWGDKDEHLISHLHEFRDYFIGKTQRAPTFNQLTAPYHEPFCLDIYVSKGSVRASIIHRVTSKVVAVAHSISKDMKFDLGSTKNRNTCAAVGEVLAQRALADDIHNVVYTPRKGEKLEGKLQIVLKSIIDNGIDVKVKLKQRKSRKTGGLMLRV